MRKATLLLPLALLVLGAFPAAGQEIIRVMICTGQCFGVDDTGARVPLARGAELPPGQSLATGPNSYAQIALGRETAFAVGENTRVRFDRRDASRDVVILDEGRIRVVGGEAIGRPATRPLELRTSEGNLVLRSVDIEVKNLPQVGNAGQATTLVKLNLGDARLGDMPITKESVQGIVGGRLLDRAIPVRDIALVARKDVPPAKAATPATELPLAEQNLPPQLGITAFDSVDDQRTRNRDSHGADRQAPMQR